MPAPKVLIVEDDVIIAFGYVHVLENQSYEILGTAGSNAQALKLLHECSPDVALLDVNLNGEESEPVASALANLGVPFLVLTATPSASISGSNLRSAPMLTKPVSDASLVEALRDIKHF
ncbi:MULTISPECIES: response regulator [Roseovarius]|uniref:response regulator n=1 Tax=Roseovarius TaxID=74030 RepID=UPI00273FA391|nr:MULTISPECIES: response regulator [unclassified Roseovarius]